jgi:hypothetical protein
MLLLLLLLLLLFWCASTYGASGSSACLTCKCTTQLPMSKSLSLEAIPACMVNKHTHRGHTLAARTCSKCNARASRKMQAGNMQHALAQHIVIRT